MGTNVPPTTGSRKVRSITVGTARSATRPPEGWATLARHARTPAPIAVNSRSASRRRSKSAMHCRLGVPGSPLSKDVDQVLSENGLEAR